MMTVTTLNPNHELGRARNLMMTGNNRHRLNLNHRLPCFRRFEIVNRNGKLETRNFRG